MKLTHFDSKTGELKLQVDTLDDLWHLERVLKAGDLVEANTLRTYKVGDREEKKHVKIRVRLENVEFAKHSNRLRVLGTIVWGEPEEFVQMGRHHTIDVSEGEKLKITKRWKQHEVNRLKEAEKESKKPRLRLIVLDDEKALSAEVRAYGIEYGAEFYSSGSKRDDGYEKAKEKYFETIASEIDRHPEAYLVAGPGFTKDNLRTYISKKNPQLLKRITFETVADAERNGVTELFSRGVIGKLVGEQRLQHESNLLGELLAHIHKDDGLAAYGYREVKAAVAASAAGTLLILDEYLRTDKDAEVLIEVAEGGGCEIVIFSCEGDPGAKLKGFGKIAALLRYRLKNE